MKLRHVHIENFKGVRELDIDFTPSYGGAPVPLMAILGDNGSGKTTVLQAIALTVSLATGRTRSSDALAWNGFLVERLETLGRTSVSVEFSIDPDETGVTRGLYRTWKAMRHSLKGPAPLVLEEWPSVVDVEPSSLLSRSVRVSYSQGKLNYHPSAGPPDPLIALCGRRLLEQLIPSRPSLSSHRRGCGDVYWFDQYRSLASPDSANPRNGAGGKLDGGWSVGVEHLREYLVGAWGYHASPHSENVRDIIPVLERGFGEIFTGTRFVGIQPRANVSDPRPNDFYFLLERDGKIFDIAEMSSGEQAIFAILYDFVRLDIAKSIVLIDELELHLHPPQQQALLAALPKIGPDCQFVITTHSPFIEGAIPDEYEVRLPGGRRCL